MLDANNVTTSLSSNSNKLLASTFTLLISTFPSLSAKINLAALIKFWTSKVIFSLVSMYEALTTNVGFSPSPSLTISLLIVSSTIFETNIVSTSSSLKLNKLFGSTFTLLISIFPSSSARINLAALINALISEVSFSFVSIYEGSIINAAFSPSPSLIISRLIVSSTIFEANIVSTSSSLKLNKLLASTLIFSRSTFPSSSAKTNLAALINALISEVSFSFVSIYEGSIVNWASSPFPKSVITFLTVSSMILDANNVLISSSDKSNKLLGSTLMFSKSIFPSSSAKINLAEAIKLINSFVSFSFALTGSFSSLIWSGLITSVSPAWLLKSIITFLKVSSKILDCNNSLICSSLKSSTKLGSIFIFSKSISSPKIVLTPLNNFFNSDLSNSSCSYLITKNPLVVPSSFSTNS